MMAANGAAWNAKVASHGSVAGHGGSVSACGVMIVR